MTSKIVILKLPASILETLDIKSSKQTSGSRTAKGSAGDASPAVGTPQPHTSGARSMATVNASLRALDKSGKPCRRWRKEPITLKSFTGIEYSLSSWKGEEDIKSQPSTTV